MFILQSECLLTHSHHVQRLVSLQGQENASCRVCLYLCRELHFCAKKKKAGVGKDTPKTL